MDDDVLGEDVIGAARAMVRAGKAPNIRRALQAMTRAAPTADWRARMAPGVAVPGELLEPLPLVPNLNGGIFTAAITAIEFAARPQRPFRAERLIVTVRRTGAAGTIIFSQGLFVGTSLQQVQRGNLDIEVYGPLLFDGRMKFIQCEPGVDIAIPCLAQPAPGGADTVAVSIQFLGHTVGN